MRTSCLACFSVVIFGLFLSGCSPLSGADLKATLEALGQDKASACLLVGGGAGTGAIIPGPGIPIGGGYGFFWFGRSNEANSTVTLDKDGCKITHGVK